MKKKNSGFYIAISLLSSAVIIFACLFISYLVAANDYKKQLENVYKKNFYEVVSNINDLEIDVSKIVATSDIETQKELLTGIYNTSTIGINNINLLPISYSKLTNINNFLNRLGGFSYSLLLGLNDGGEIDDNDYKQITSLHQSLRNIQYDLNEYISGIKYDYNILDDIEYDNYDNEDFSAGLINTESSSTKVPTLIYDGPFSDSVLNKEIVGLEDTLYSMEECLDYLKSIYPDGKVAYIGDAEGKFATYNFNVESGDNTLYVSITKMGRFLLSITSFGGSNGYISQEVDGEKIAEDFAKKLGLENMYSVWTQTTGNVMYVNLAPIVNKVIYYSDLVKVKVDLVSQTVVGYEATNYATNHKERTFSSSISLSNAQKKINNILVIKERNFVIIPDKYVGEVSAYEFICTWQNYTYYIYLDSNTGKEVNIQRIISTTNGDLLM